MTFKPKMTNKYDPTTIMQTHQEITVKDLPIRLGQFLKFANLVQDGFEARVKIQEGVVLVNGNIETKRGKKLFAEDTVTMDGETWVLRAE